MGKLWLRANQPTGDRWIKLKDGSNGLFVMVGEINTKKTKQ